MTVPPLHQLLPHADPMILLGSINQWDKNNIECVASSHLHIDNPLRQQGILSIYAGVEYAAQAMAVHMRLCLDNDQEPPRKGFVAVASKLEAQRQNLDEAQTSLVITLHQLVANDQGSLYEFIISADNQQILSGQLLGVIERSNPEE